MLSLHQRALLFLTRCHLMISIRSCKGLMRKTRLHNKNKLATMLAQLSAAHFHPMLTKIIKQWHRPVLVLCFQQIQIYAFRLKLNSKKLFPWFISAKVWRVAIQVLLKLSLKTSIILSFILASQTRSIFSCKSLPWAVTFAHPTWRTINYEEFCSCLFVYITNLYHSIRQKKFRETPSSSGAIFWKNNSALEVIRCISKRLLRIFSLAWIHLNKTNIYERIIYSIPLCDIKLLSSNILKP